MKTILSLLFPVFLLFIASISTSYGQTGNSTGTITIDATGEESVPADRIFFQININRYHEDATVAFEEHKKLEQFLTELILDQNIPEEQINTTPVNISPRRHSSQQGFETRQTVTLRLDDLTRFESMQVTLIENGFDTFSAHFTTSDEEPAREKALKRAVANARHKAEILAESSGKKLGGVDHINYTSSAGVVRMEAQLSMDRSEGSLLQFQKTITIRENVRVQFFLIDES